jgi:hypothetical protein
VADLTDEQIVQLAKKHLRTETTERRFYEDSWTEQAVDYHSAIPLVRAALAAAGAPPAAQQADPQACPKCGRGEVIDGECDRCDFRPAGVAPARAPLTEKEIAELWHPEREPGHDIAPGYAVNFARDVERAHGIGVKENGDG